MAAAAAMPRAKGPSSPAFGQAGSSPEKPAKIGDCANGENRSGASGASPSIRTQREAP